MTTPEEQPTVGDFLARLEFKYDNDVLDFLKTGKGVVVVEDKVANIPLPKGAKGEKGDIGKLREGDVRYFNHRTDEAEAAAEASEASSGRSKASEEAAKTSETNAKTSETKAKTSETNAKTSETKAKTSETNAKSSETKAKASETNAKTSETKAKSSEEESAVQAELSRDAAVLAITAAATVAQYVGDGFPEGKVSAPVGSIYTDRLATNGAIRWIKTSGTGSSGWQVEYGDTGWRNMIQYFPDSLGGIVQMRRTDDIVHWNFLNFKAPDQGPSWNQWPIPTNQGFAPSSHFYFAASPRNTLGSEGPIRIGNNNVIYLYDPKPERFYSATFSYPTDNPWPPFLPGTPS